MLERNRAALDKAGYRRQRAVMLIARALAAEDADRDNAKVFALEAVKLAPTLVPAAALAGCMLAEGGELRRASRIVAKAWRANPHPDLAQTYAELRFGDAARDRLTRIEALTKKTPGHLEGALAIARAALDAREFAKARAALAPYLSAPTKRIALLMAELERAERNDEGRAREWMARALNAAPDPAWTADGYVSDRWLPVSPVSGRLDAFDWRVPLTGIVSTPVIEPEPSAVAPIEPAPERQREKADTPPASAAAAIPSPRRRGRQLKPKPEPVIPLVHAPDDPGPDAVEESAPPAEPQSGGWRKILE
jgi:HemY protein